MKKFSKAQEFLFNNLIKERKSPCFEVRSSQIQILKDPVDYYLALHKLAKQSELRISMSALYMGTGNLEKYLVERLDKKLETSPNLKMNILMDYMRGTRIVSKDNSSSFELMRGLKEKHVHRGDKLRIGFWHHPDTGFWKGKMMAGPLREIFGVHHIKAHVFDHNVVITGANLSEDYFTDRQDRCYVINDCEPLANYFDDLIGILTDCSYNVTENGTLDMLPQYPEPHRKPKDFKNQMSHHLRFLRFQHRTQIPTNEELTIEDFFAEDKPKNKNEEDVVLIDSKSKSRPFKQSSEVDQTNQNLNLKTQDTKSSQAEAEASLAAEEQVLIQNTLLSDEYILNKIVQINKKNTQVEQDDGRVFIFPTLQMNVIDYREDENLFLGLLKYYSQPNNNLKHIQLATGYLNLQKEFLQILNQHKNLITDLLTSSPRANGFYKAGKFKKFIPGMYRANELSILKQNKNNQNIKIHEWEMGEWTYHAKGAWFYENESTSDSKRVDDTSDLPVMTVIGSSNYSARSNRRDTEAQLYIVSDCLSFRKKMKEESDHLFKNSKQVSINHILKEDEDKLNWKEKLLAKLLNKLL
eukprot:403365574